MRALKRLNIQVDGQRWLVSLWSEAAMEDMEEDRKAVTVMETRRISFSKEHITTGLVMHELIHAHCWKSVRDASTLDGEEMEEIICCSLERQCGEFMSNLHKICTAFTVTK